MSEELQNLKFRLFNRSKWNGECLESTYKPKSQSGYPLIKFRRSTISVHRASYLVHNGEIPEGMWVLHKCDNPLCFRIDHLFLGDPQDNTNDMINKNRQNYFGAKVHSDEIITRAIKMRKDGKTYKEIEKILDIPCGSLQYFFKDQEFYNVPKYPQHIRDKAFDLRRSGIKCKEIQNILNIPKRSLTRIMKDFIM